MHIGFTGNRLDRADHVRGDSAALESAARDPEARLLALDALDPSLDGEGRLLWSDMSAADPAGSLIFLGYDEGAPRFAQIRPDDVSVPRSPALYKMLDLFDPGDAAIYGTARVLIDWHARHRFCARCGTRTDPFRAGWMRKCGACETEHYPRVDPVVIMLAEHDGRALVGRGNGWPPGRYSALAGFVEPGETFEEAVAREIHEETGVRVSDVRYVASQPWPFPGQLMIGCFATASGDTLAINPAEIEHAMWVTKDDVRAALARAEGARFVAPPRYAIAHTLLNAWVNRAL